MNLKRVLIGGAVLLVLGITVLQLFFNQIGWLGGNRQDASAEKFRVGFLPVT
jgi:hypothetical protein